MIHEFIDSKKKAQKNNSFSKGRTLQDSVETCSVDQSGSEWPPTTLVPPWLNHLGLKLKNNHITGVFDHKTEKLNPDFKNQNEYEQEEDEEGKSIVEDNEKSSYFESLPKTSEKKGSAQKLESCRNKSLEEKLSRDSKIPVIWSSKTAELESSSTDSIISLLTSKKNFKTSETEISAKIPPDNSLFKNDQNKKQKVPKKRHKAKRQIASGCTSMLRDINVDSLLEERAKEILENYSKKRVHSAVSDIKQFEAKLLLLQTKINLGKLTPADLRWLHSIRVQAGSKENFDKLMRHVRETNLKEIFDTQNCILKSMQIDNDEENTKAQSKEEKRILMSTDDEDNVKRFSELLRKNQSEEEKRKCLEEVRNYFERKRRTRLTKCWTLNSNLNETNTGKNEDTENKKAQMKKAFSLRSAADWKSKFKISDAEVVAKAVDETLQKFVELYNFHVSPGVINSMKNKVLKGIQGYPFEFESSSRGQYNVSHEAEGDVPATNLQKNKKDSLKNEFLQEDSKTKNLKEKTPPRLQPNDMDAYGNEKINWLRNELEDYINKTNKEAIKLKVQSIVLEENTKDSNSKSVEFIYNFTKKSLEQKKLNSETKIKSKLSFKDVEVQVGKTSSTDSTTSQTVKLVSTCDKYTQKEKNSQKSVDIQTEGAFAIELKKLKESDVSAGLYRMVKSKEAGRFYLYPEKGVRSAIKVSKNDKGEDGKLAWKKLSGTFGTSERNKIKNVRKDASGDVIENVKPKQEADETGVQNEKQEYLWLWDGEKINSGADLKAHVESLVNEKLRKMSSEFQEHSKLKINNEDFSTGSIAKARGTGSEDDLEFKILHLGFPVRNDQEFRLKEESRNFKEEGAETQSLKEPVFFTSEEKLVKDNSRQSSQKAFSSLIVKATKSSGKSQQSWKRTYLRKKRRIRERRKGQSRRNIAGLKCLFNKRMSFEDSSLKDSVCGSGSTLESNTSSYTKTPSDDILTLVFGLKDGLSCKRNNFRRIVNEQTQIINGKKPGTRSTTESEGSDQRLQNHMHWKLVEKVLHRVNRKERKGLWNDLRELVKSKMGKDIDNGNAKEVCIQIEQDMRGTSEEKAKHTVLAKGYYVKDEGDVEVEIDLTLNDLEKILRKRERSWRKQSLCYKRKSRNLKSNSRGQSRSDFSSIQEFRHILRSVSKSRPSPLSGDVRIIKRNKDN